MFKLISNERKRISGCLVIGMGENERKDFKRATFDVIVVFIILIVVIVSRYKHNKTNQIV